MKIEIIKSMTFQVFCDLYESCHNKNKKHVEPTSMPFLVFRRDHVRATSEIIFAGIINGPIWGSFAVLYIALVSAHENITIHYIPILIIN